MVETSCCLINFVTSFAQSSVSYLSLWSLKLCGRFSLATRTIQTAHLLILPYFMWLQRSNWMWRHANRILSCYMQLVHWRTFWKNTNAETIASSGVLQMGFLAIARHSNNIRFNVISFSWFLSLTSHIIHIVAQVQMQQQIHECCI